MDNITIIGEMKDGKGYIFAKPITNRKPEPNDVVLIGNEYYRIIGDGQRNSMVFIHRNELIFPAISEFIKQQAASFASNPIHKDYQGTVDDFLAGTGRM